MNAVPAVASPALSYGIQCHQRAALHKHLPFAKKLSAEIAIEKKSPFSLICDTGAHWFLAMTGKNSCTDGNWWVLSVLTTKVIEFG